jgi:hypothetical protein
MDTILAPLIPLTPLNIEYGLFEIIDIDVKCYNQFNQCYHKIKIKIKDDNTIKDFTASSKYIAGYYNYYNLNIPYHYSRFF